MTTYSNPPPHRYAGQGFDRAAHHRQDPRWLADARRSPGSRVLLLSGLEVLITDTDNPEVAILEVADLGRPLEETAFFLGLHNGSPLFAADFGPMVRPGTRFVELRSVGAFLEPLEAGWCAYSRGLAYWHGRHRYCGTCGGRTVIEQGGHVRRCQLCDAIHFPRSDPAVIVLVTNVHPEDGERCLLGRSARFPAGLYSTLAGFVEPGESLEETVRREIFEEAGVVVHDPVYRSSQPWPFPASLMLGFRAVAESDLLRIAPDELVDARWLSRAELLDEERCPVKLPNRDSIARHLIEDWLYEQLAG